MNLETIQKISRELIPPSILDEIRCAGLHMADKVVELYICCNEKIKKVKKEVDG